MLVGYGQILMCRLRVFILSPTMRSNIQPSSDTYCYFVNVIMHSLQNVHELNAYRADRVCLCPNDST
jgi:hypothetical protein